MTVFIKVVLVSIVLVSVMNVMVMAVYERIREIGAIAAIGTRPSRIILASLQPAWKASRLDPINPPRHV